MNQKKTRNIVFDLLKLFAIFCVLWGHMIQQFTVFPGVENKIFRVIYSFHMPLFMTISGYFAVSVIKKSFWETVWHKTQQLLIPAVTGGIIVGVLRVFLESNFSVLQIPKFLFGCLWFLKSAFLCTIIYWLGSKLIPYHQWIGLLITLLFSQLVNLFYLRYMFPAFLLGVWLRNEYSLFQTYRKSITLSSGTMWIVLLYFFTSETLKANWGGYFITPEISVPILLHILHRTITGLIGAVFFIGLFEIIFSRVTSPLIQKTSRIGQYTLGIYILQTIILETILSKVIHLRYAETILFDAVLTPLASLVILFLCLWFIKKIRKNKIGRATLLGEKINANQW